MSTNYSVPVSLRIGAGILAAFFMLRKVIFSFLLRFAQYTKTEVNYILIAAGSRKRVSRVLIPIRTIGLKEPAPEKTVK